MYDSESRPARRSASVRAARWSATHPWRAIALWLAFVAACFAIGQAAGTHKATNLDQAVGQSGRAAHWLHDSGMDDPAKESILITSRSGPFNAAAGGQAGGPAAAAGPPRSAPRPARAHEGAPPPKAVARRRW